MSETITLSNELNLPEDGSKSGFIGRILSSAAAIETTDPAHDRPVRCRAIVLDPGLTSLIVVKRTKPGEEPYAVLPGGGVEAEDKTPLDTVYREIAEELSIDATAINFRTDRAIAHKEQWIYVGVASHILGSLAVSGPESSAPPEKGTYSPEWISLEDVFTENLLPAAVRDILVEASSTQE